MPIGRRKERSRPSDGKDRERKEERKRGWGREEHRQKNALEKKGQLGGEKRPLITAILLNIEKKFNPLCFKVLWGSFNQKIFKFIILGDRG